MKKSSITITFNTGWDADRIEKVVKCYAEYACIDRANKVVCFVGPSAKAKAFVRTCEAIEPIISFTIKTINE